MAVFGVPFPADGDAKRACHAALKMQHSLDLFNQPVPSSGSASPDANGDFAYSLNLGEGSFRVRLQPDSLPQGYLAPPPVGITVTINQVTGERS